MCISIPITFLILLFDKKHISQYGKILFFGDTIPRNPHILVATISMFAQIRHVKSVPFGPQEIRILSCLEHAPKAVEGGALHSSPVLNVLPLKNEHEKIGEPGFGPMWKPKIQLSPKYPQNHHIKGRFMALSFPHRSKLGLEIRVELTNIGDNYVHNIPIAVATRHVSQANHLEMAHFPWRCLSTRGYQPTNQ